MLAGKIDIGGENGEGCDLRGRHARLPVILPAARECMSWMSAEQRVDRAGSSPNHVRFSAFSFKRRWPAGR
jgi:hypothetical protein